MYCAGVLGALGAGPSLACIQAVAEPNIRATAIAIGMFCSALVGQGGGPFLIGLVSDYLTPVYGECQALRFALLGSTLLIFWAAFHFFRAARTLQKERVN